MQVKTYILTVYQKKKIMKIIRAKCSSFSAPLTPLMGWSRLLGGVNGSNGVSAKSQPHMHTRSLQHVFNVTKFK